ncbi:testis-expressed protein 2-like [Ambystoma mexicanum]|uniref:testis-expressed protein 2-like n=1 Tax=Ambystoma mexicanum TaxID=8296 RepID=UPI0037E7F4F7
MAEYRKSSQDSECFTNSQCPQRSPRTGQVVRGSQGIIIQLTAAASDDHCGSPEENELIFALDDDEVRPSTTYSEGAMSNELLDAHSLSANEGHCPQLFPLDSGLISDISFGSLPNSSPQAMSPLLPSSPKPLINLVKSLSTEIESKETSPLRPKPLLNLVKSISTEISRLEPEVTQSKSDSKLNVHLWRQITQPKNKNGDSRTAPSSPSSSPSENKGSFFKVQEVEARLEDTKRRLSEAMQEPLSMLSKIIGDEVTATPRHKPPNPGSSIQESPTGHVGDQHIFEAKNARTLHGKAEGDKLGVAESTGKNLRKNSQQDYCSSEPKWVPAWHCGYEICSFDDVIQVVEVGHREGTGEGQRLPHTLDGFQPSQPCGAVPCKTLACVAILAYNYFILPLPAYISGLFLGLAGGFMLGILIILLLVPKTSYSSQRMRSLQERLECSMLMATPQEPDILKGWMNEMYSYDPEMYHPSLTHSVFVTLDGSTMKLSYPKTNVPRRATQEEESLDTTFTSHRSYDLTNAKVFLFPMGLARKRIWNKKYPICIVFVNQEDLTCRGAAEWEAFAQREEGQGQSSLQGQEGAIKPPGDAKEVPVYLFGRTGREKEEWYQHLSAASRQNPRDKQSSSRSEARLGLLPNQLPSPSGRTAPSNGSSRGSTEDIPALFKPKDLAGNVKQKILLDYKAYMSRCIQAETSSPLLSPCLSASSSPTTRRKSLSEAHANSDPYMAWINALIGRIFWDFLREKYWADQVANKIQKKLSKIKLPYFMNELTLTDLDMGTSVPLILCASPPTLDNRGLWVDMEIAYSGSLQMTLETKMNLCKLGKEVLQGESGQTDDSKEGVRLPRVVLLADSDEESSSAGSSDEEDIPPAETPGILGDRATCSNVEGYAAGNSTSRKILRFVDKIAKSKYFQKATENEYIKKKIEEMSNTPLLLTVEVQELEGTLAVNIPPPPTDRLWYSFRIPPRLELKVRPKLGEREVTFIHVLEWIEKKLEHEFQKVLVMPNMDDLYLPIMHSGLDPQPHHTAAGPFKWNYNDCEKRF